MGVLAATSKCEMSVRTCENRIGKVERLDSAAANASLYRRAKELSWYIFSLEATARPDDSPHRASHE
jgi:hypothetical protein